MAESIGAVRIDIIGNAEDLKVEVARAKTLVSSMGPEFEKSYAKMNQSQKTATLAALKFEQQIGKTRDEIRLMSLAARGAAPEALEKVRQKLLEARNASQGAGVAFNAYGKSAKELQFAMRGLPAQITDIGVSLASGQRPMMVLLQQGGQLKDLFGGIRPAATALAGAVRGMINPFTLAAGAVAGLGYAWAKAASEADAFNRAIILTGNVASATEQDLAQMADRIEAVTHVTTGAARDAVAQAAATGRFTKDQIEDVARAAVAMQHATGKAIEETIAEFVRIADDPAQALKTLNKSQHLVSEEMRKQIELLQDTGKEAAAASAGIKAAADEQLRRADDIENHLSLWADLWKNVGDAARGAGDAIADLGREEGALTRLINSGFGRYAIRPLLPLSQDFGQRGQDSNSAPGFSASFGPQFNIPGISPAAPFSLTTPRVPFRDASPRDFVAKTKEESNALREFARAAREADRALAAFDRRQIQREQEFIDGMRAQARAREQFEETIARLNGPEAYAKYQYDQQIAEIKRLGEAAGKTAQEIADAQALVMSPEQEKAAARLKEIMAEQVRIMTGVRYATEDMFAAFLDGSKSATEALEDFARNLQRIAARILAEKAVRYLFSLFGGGYNFNPGNYSDKGGFGSLDGLGNFDLPSPIASNAAPASLPLIPALAGAAKTASASSVKVEIVNNGTPAKAAATSERMPDGSQLIRVVLDAVAEDVARGGMVARAGKARFGWKEAV